MTALLTDEEIIPVARTHGENVSSVKSDQNAAIHDFTAGARFARSIYEARLAEDAKVRAGLVEALEAVICMSDAGPTPRKFDEALSWRATDLKARSMADAALAAAKEIK